MGSLPGSNPANSVLNINLRTGKKTVGDTREDCGKDGNNVLELGVCFGNFLTMTGSLWPHPETAVGTFWETLEHCGNGVYGL